jgi:hypothetical protein
VGERANVPSPARRGFLGRLARAALAPLPAVALIEGRADRTARAGDRDMAILLAAVALENQAIALYDLGLRGSLFAAGLRGYAEEFRGDHLGHRDTQVALIEERGGRPPDPGVPSPFARPRDGDAMIRQALEIERAAQEAYAALISGIRTDDYLLSAAFILIDEVRHVTVWRRTLGLSIY